MNETKHTPGPWETTPPGSWGKGRARKWVCKRHEYRTPEEPAHEGDLSDEWGVYPPLGECGPVALASGEANARLISAAPDLLSICEKIATWTNTDINEEEGTFTWFAEELVPELFAAIAAAKGEA